MWPDAFCTEHLSIGDYKHLLQSTQHKEGLAMQDYAMWIECKLNWVKIYTNIPEFAVNWMD